MFLALSLDYQDTSSVERLMESLSKNRTLESFAKYPEPTFVEKYNDNLVYLFWSELEPDIELPFELLTAYGEVEIFAFYHYEELDSEIGDPLAFMQYKENKVHKLICENVFGWRVVDELPYKDREDFANYIHDVFSQIKEDTETLSFSGDFPTADELPQTLEEYQRFDIKLEYEEERLNYLKFLEQYKSGDAKGKYADYDCDFDKKHVLGWLVNFYVDKFNEDNIRISKNDIRVVGYRTMLQPPKELVWFTAFEVKAENEIYYAINVNYSEECWYPYFVSNPQHELSPKKLMVGLYHNLPFLEFDIWSI